MIKKNFLFYLFKIIFVSLTILFFQLSQLQAAPAETWIQYHCMGATKAVPHKLYPDGQIKPFYPTGFDPKVERIETYYIKVKPTNNNSIFKLHMNHYQYFTEMTKHCTESRWKKTDKSVLAGKPFLGWGTDHTVVRMQTSYYAVNDPKICRQQNEPCQKNVQCCQTGLNQNIKSHYCDNMTNSCLPYSITSASDDED
jgi:hypothetical protein